MKVRRVVIIKNILITIPKKRLISGMGGQVTQRGKKILRSLTRYFEIESVWT
jgi:hypothetical protein